MSEKKKVFDLLGSRPYSEWPDLIKPGEIAALFRVDPKTVGRWFGDPTKISSEEIVSTPGKHRRCRKEFVYKMFTGQDPPKSDKGDDDEEEED